MPVSVAKSEENSVVANIMVKKLEPVHNLFFSKGSERPDDVEKYRWTAKFEELWPTDPHD